MQFITDTPALSAACANFAEEEFITIDTEFMRSTSYYPHLCLIQIAGSDRAVLIDPLADGLTLDPFYALMCDPRPIKVFHAARQDIEAIFHHSGQMPCNVFDTQLAAMVCGFGESIGYDQLVLRIVGEKIDKSARNTDWAKRPLTDKQAQYALADVTHLRPIYLALNDQLSAKGREDWLGEEVARLLDPSTYIVKPENAWQKLKIKPRRPSDYNILQAVAAWREHRAQRQNLPRGHVLKDEAIADIVARRPADSESLAKLRGISGKFVEGEQGANLLKILAKTYRMREDCLSKEIDLRPKHLPRNNETLAMLRLLLNYVSEHEEVAASLIATTKELERLAAGEEEDLPVLKDWRAEIFGHKAKALLRGELGLKIHDGQLQLMERNLNGGRKN